MRASEPCSASKSRGEATPRVTRLASRSRSSTPDNSLRISSRSTVFALSWPTASSLSSISGRAISGRRIQERSSLAPMPVEVSSRATSRVDRKSTRLNSSHLVISYAVFCLKKKKNTSVYPLLLLSLVFFFNDTATTEIYTLSLHDALPIYLLAQHGIRFELAHGIQPFLDLRASDLRAKDPRAQQPGAHAS